MGKEMEGNLHPKQRLPKPPWLKVILPTGNAHEAVRSIIRQEGLQTVCQSARCPNLWECFSRRTATFLIMGDRCTRRCRFCAVGKGPASPPDPGEGARVAKAVCELGLRYAVLTSVTRDDLPDGGAACFAETIREVRAAVPEIQVEVLIPDFQGDPAALQMVVEAGPDVLNHNIETVERLYPHVRPEAIYQRSLELLDRARQASPSLVTKSGLMLGLGESSEDIRQTLEDLLAVGCSLVTLGQYLQPSSDHLPVDRYVPPEEFDRWRQLALDMGFLQVASGPLVRSSYHAADLYRARIQKGGR